MRTVVFCINIHSLIDKHKTVETRIAKEETEKNNNKNNQEKDGGGGGVANIHRQRFLNRSVNLNARKRIKRKSLLCERAH